VGVGASVILQDDRWREGAAPASDHDFFYLDLFAAALLHDQ